MSYVVDLEIIIKKDRTFYALIKNEDMHYIFYRKRNPMKLVLQKLEPSYELFLLENDNMHEPEIVILDDFNFFLYIQDKLPIDYLENIYEGINNF